MNFESIAENIIKKTISAGATDCDVVLAEGSGKSISCRLQKIEDIEEKHRALSRHHKGSHHSNRSLTILKKTSKNMKNNFKDVFTLAKLIKEIIHHEINEQES